MAPWLALDPACASSAVASPSPKWRSGIVNADGAHCHSHKDVPVRLEAATPEEAAAAEEASRRVHELIAAGAGTGS
jgi:hypothetical protein